MSLSIDVLNYLAVVLSRQTLAATDPNLEATAALVAKARCELLAALEAAEQEAGG